MPDALTRSDPVPASPYSVNGVKISLAPPMARYSLRTRQAQTLAALVGFTVPTKIGATEGGVACIGPDEWLMRVPAGTNIQLGAGLALAVTDVSERSVCLIVEGPDSAQILMSGCPLDFDRFPVGRATRTIYETVEIILIRDSENCFHVEVWCSFAAWLWTALTTAASH